MVWYDIVVLIILLLAGWRGAQRGLVTQLAWIAAVTLSFKFADSLAPSLTPHISVGEPDNPVRHWIAMFILFVGFSVASFLVARTIDNTLQKAKLKELDRFFGAILGLVFGLSIVQAATFFTSVWPPTRAAVLESRTGHYSCVLLDTIKPLTPAHFHEYFQEYQNRLPHEQHDDLGTGTDEVPDFIGDSLDGGFELPDLTGGLAEETSPDREGSSGGSQGTSSPSFRDVLNALPTSLREEFSDRIQRHWSAATAQQKEALIEQLNRSFDSEMPGRLADFFSATGGRSAGQGGGRQQINYTALLNEIGDIYQDRNRILQRTREHLSGLPVQVQEAVIYDWHADLTMQPTDPDPLTDIQTRLDERILRQLERARVPITELSFELQQRLNQPRR